MKTKYNTSSKGDALLDLMTVVVASCIIGALLGGLIGAWGYLYAACILLACVWDKAATPSLVVMGLVSGGNLVAMAI